MGTEALDKLTEVRKRATSLALAFIALFMFLSLLTFSGGDLVETRWPAAESLGNVCGRIGAVLANWLMMNFGYASYFAAALAVGFAVRCLMKRDRIDAWMSIVGGIVMLVSAAAAAQLLGPRTAHMPGSGGIVGITVSNVLVRYVGSLGSWLVTVLLFTLGGLLMSADELVIWASKHALARVQGWLKARREQRALPVAAPPIKVSKPPIKTGKRAPKLAEADFALHREIGLRRFDDFIQPAFCNPVGENAVEENVEMVLEFIGSGGVHSDCASFHGWGPFLFIPWRLAV